MCIIKKCNQFLTFPLYKLEGKILITPFIIDVNVINEIFSETSAFYD